MLNDIDEALRALVEREALGSVGVEVAFDAPTKDWVAGRTAPTVDIYLYDIREDLGRREVGYEGTRNDSGRIVSRRPPPRRFKLSFLVTAWTQRPEDEHRLLASLLACFIRHEVLPKEFLGGVLKNEPTAVLMSVALPPPQDRQASDVWSALGGELKPSLDLVINAPFDTARVAATGPPVLEDPRFAFVGAQGASEFAPMGARRRRERPAQPTRPFAAETVRPGKGESGRGFIIKEIPPQ